MADLWKGGVPLGFDKHGRAIAYEGDAPVAVYGPPGTSKTVGVVLNQLLSDTSRRSYFVPDYKGEIYSVTHKFRRSLPEHRVRVVNAFDLLGVKSDGWNPLAALNPDDPGFEDDCRAIGDACIAMKSNEPFFPLAAKSAVAGAVNFEVRDAKAPEVPSLANVRAILTANAAAQAKLIRAALALGDPEITARLSKFLPNDEGEQTREIQSIKSTIEAELSWLTHQVRKDMVKPGGVDFREMKRTPTTTYFMLPTTEANSPYYRVAVSAALRSLYTHEGVPVTLLLDEAYALGHLEELKKAASIMRGYRSRVVTIWQSMEQAREHYPTMWGMFGSGATLAFRPADLATAEHLSKRAGRRFVPVYGKSDPKPGQAEGDGGWKQEARDRFTTDDLFRMPPGRALVWLEGDGAPRISRVKGYFEIPKLARHAEPNPYVTGATGRVPRKHKKLFAAALASMLVVPLPWLHGSSSEPRPAAITYQPAPVRPAPPVFHLRRAAPASPARNSALAR